MKPPHIARTRHCLQTAALVAVSTLLASTPAARGQDLLLSGFDDDLAPSGFWSWWGELFQDFIWAPGEDADGNPASGAMNLRYEFDTSLADNQFATGWALSGNGAWDASVQVSGADYQELAFDIKWDPTSTVTLADFNSNGFGSDTGFPVGFASPAWAPALPSNGGPMVTEEWQRVSVPIDAASNIAGLLFKKWQPSDPGALNGVAAVFIDNMTLIGRSEPPPPTTLSIEPAEVLGCQVIAARQADQYQRQNLYSLAAEGTSWYGNPNPVTYSVTFADFPGTEFPEFQAHLMLSPDGTIGTSPDWNDPNVVFFDIRNYGETSQCTLRYKVEEPNGNSQLYGAGVLGTHTGGAVLGTWSFTFESNTEITVTSPDATSTTFSMPAEHAPMFESAFSMGTYFGVQPNQLSNIGQSVTYSQIMIVDGTDVVLDEKFETAFDFDKIDPDNWLSPPPNGPEAVWVIDSPEAFWFNWTLPAADLEPYMSPSLADGSWTFVDIPPSQIGSRMSILFQGIDHPGGDEAYIRLEPIPAP